MFGSAPVNEGEKQGSQTRLPGSRSWNLCDWSFYLVICLFIYFVSLFFNVFSFNYFVCLGI